MNNSIGPFLIAEFLLALFSTICAMLAIKLWKKAKLAKIPRITSGPTCRYSDPLCDELVCYCKERKRIGY